MSLYQVRRPPRAMHDASNRGEQVGRIKERSDPGAPGLRQWNLQDGRIIDDRIVGETKASAELLANAA
ncbi:MAG: hypothetical protein WBF93_20875 [Pirellulales bacterium]